MCAVCVLWLLWLLLLWWCCTAYTAWRISFRKLAWSLTRRRASTAPVQVPAPAALWELWKHYPISRRNLILEKRFFWRREKNRLTNDDRAQQKLEKGLWLDWNDHMGYMVGYNICICICRLRGSLMLPPTPCGGLRLLSSRKENANFPLARCSLF